MAAKSKQVPLVIYRGGKRLQVGMASVSEDGRIEAQVSKDARSFVNELSVLVSSEVCLNPTPETPQYKHTKIQES